MNPKSLNDGRYIDGTLALLEGEGAEQNIKTPDPHPERKQPPVWTLRPDQSFGMEKTYYDVPMLKEPVWIWTIPAYFYVGGAAGSAALLGSVVDLSDRKDLAGLAKKCRIISLAGTLLGAALLISDLGRKERFLNMLRIFRPTSPMSVGSWTLAVNGALSSTSLLLPYLDGKFHRLARLVSLKNAVSGITLAGYTGVLLGNTPIPVWQESRKALPVLFLASGATATAAILQMMPANKREDKVAHYFSIISIVFEMASARKLEQEIRVGRTVRSSLREGRPGKLWRAGKIMAAAGLALSLMPGRSMKKKIVTAALESSGAVVMRYALFYAGKTSARDPVNTSR